MSDRIALSAATRANLLSLQSTTKLIGRTQERLSTGLKVNSALDDATAFFQARALSNRAKDLAEVKDGIDQGISTLKAAINGIDGITRIIEQMRGLAIASKTQNVTARAASASQAQGLASQISLLAADANYQGVNLINNVSTNLTVVFNEDNTANLVITAIDLTGSGLSVNSTFGSYATDTDIDQAISFYNTALTTLRSGAQGLGANNSLLQTRLDFTNEVVNTLDEGSDKLTLADINEEGANLLALQTRQQLGVNSLALASQSEQAILSLFG